VGFETQGAEGFQRLAAQLERVARTLEQQLVEAAEQSVEPLKSAIPASAMRTLPRRGGLNRRIAASRVTVRRGRDRLSVVTSNNYQIQNIDRGRVRHPVFNTGKWVAQSVAPGWWTKPITVVQPKIRRESNQALQRILNEIKG
jgi:hypothetical protein